jgi:hypothetical protein
MKLWAVGSAKGTLRGSSNEERINLKTEMAESESAAVIGPTRLPASRVASPCRCNRCEPESLVEPSTTPSSSLAIPVSRLKMQPLRTGKPWATKPERRHWRHRIRRHHWQHKFPGDLGQYPLDTAAAIPNVLRSQAWHRLRPLELRNSG